MIKILYTQDASRGAKDGNTIVESSAKALLHEPHVNAMPLWDIRQAARLSYLLIFVDGAASRALPSVWWWHQEALAQRHRRTEVAKPPCLLLHTRREEARAAVIRFMVRLLP